ncbi:MAG: hypothetical protein AB8B76_08940, partial [Congregibacter sp.]
MAPPAATCIGGRSAGNGGYVAQLTATLVAFAVLSGCATNGQIVKNDDLEPQAASVANDDSPPPPPVPERPIPESSVYPLLLAEFALRRRDFDTALDTYLDQADVLQDPAVSAHATHLAQYLQRERGAFRAVRLWVELEPDNVEANSTLATLLARQGRNREALPYLATVARAGEKAKFPVLLNRYKALRPADQVGLDSDTQALLDDDLGDDVSLRLTHALMAEERGDAAAARARLAPVFALEPYQRQA